MSGIPVRINVIHQLHANEATLPGGIKVHRQEKIFVSDYGMVPCAPYDNHFIFEDPRQPRGNQKIWITRCTCGSTAVVAGYEGYRGEASPSGMMLLCYYHSNTGKHADGSS